MSAIFRKRHCFLEQRKWKTIPFAREPSPRLISSRVQDILCDIPGFLEDILEIETLRANGSGITINRHVAALRVKVAAAIEQLSDLRWQWEDEFPGVCYEVTTRPGSTLCVDDSGEPLFQTVLFFRRLDCAMEILRFNAMFLILYNVLSLTGADTLSVSTERKTVLSDHSPIQPSANTTANALINPGEWASLDDLALEICRLVDYCLHDTFNGLGVFTLLFPLRVAYKTLKYDARIAHCIERITQDIADSKGFEIGIHIPKQEDKSSQLVV